MNDEAVMEVAPQTLPGPSTGSVQRTNLGQKDTPDILKVDSDDLKEPPTWPEVAKAGEDTGCREDVGPVQGAFPGFVPGTLQDVYPLMVGL